MKLLRALIASSSLFILLLVIAPRATRAWRAVAANENQPPVANNEAANAIDTRRNVSELWL